MKSNHFLTPFLCFCLFFCLSNPFFQPAPVKESKIPKRDRMDLAMQQEYDQTVDPALNRVPRERLLDAMAYAQHKRKEAEIRNPIAGISWEERGPNNVAGRTRAIWFDLSDPTLETVWASGVGGGLWKTTSITSNPANWVAIDDFFDNLAITSLVQHPVSHNIMYFGTGEGWYNSDAISGLGIWKSTDGGTNWTQLASTTGNAFNRIQKLLIRSNGDLFACTRNGGIQRSTDGGTSWTKVLGSGASASTNRSADIEEAANGDLYAAMGIFNNDGIYKSTNGGTSWSKLAGGLPASGFERVELACAPSNSNRVYALLQDGSANDCMGIYRTDNGGTTWTSVNNPPALGMSSFTRNQAWYDLICAVDPNNDDRVFIGGVDILVSSNAGSSWTQISQWYGGGGFQYVHADQHAIVFAPGNSNFILFGNDGGIWRTTNGTSTPPSISDRNTGFNITQYYACAIHPNNGVDYFLAGSQDNGTQQYTNAGMNATNEVTGGDGAFCHIDEDQPNIQISSYVYSNYRITSNSWSSYSSYGYGSIGSFINPTDYDSDANTLYAAYSSGQYLRISNVGLGAPVDNAIAISAFGGGSIRHVSVSDNTSNRVFFGMNNGRVVRVDNAHTGSPTATHINNGAGMPSSTVSCIAIEEGDDNHLLVTYSNYGVNSVWETEDGGSTWTNKEGNLPDMPIRWALFHPTDDNQAMLATEVGVWSTNDLSAGSVDWDPSNNGFANVRVDMLQIRDDYEVIAATHGRGLFSTASFRTPDITFLSASQSLTESSVDGITDVCKGYDEIEIALSISTAPAGNITVDLNIDAPSTADANDFEWVTGPSLTFPAGSSADQTATLRVFNDGWVEGTETLQLSFNITPAAEANVGAIPVHTITISDDHGLPDQGGGLSVQTLISEDFEAGVLPAGWSMSQASTGSDMYLFDTPANVSSASWTVPANGSTNVAATNDDACNCDKSEDRLNMPAIDLTNAISAELNFNAYYLGNTYSGATEEAYVDISIDGGLTWTPYAISSQGSWGIRTLNLAAYIGQPAVEISFRYYDDFGWLYGLALDDITVTKTVELAQNVETILSSSDTHELGPNQTVYYYDTGGEIIAKIENLSAFDFGCTTVQIDRAGTGTVDFWDAIDDANDLASKTYLVTPTNNSGIASYTITLYYSAAEIAGWEAITGKSFLNDGKIVKNPGAISNVTPANNYPDGPNIEILLDNSSLLGPGPDYAIAATFNTGFSGFGMGDPTPPVILDAVEVDFSARLQDDQVRLDWTLTDTKGLKSFSVERSGPDQIWYGIGSLESGADLQYHLMDTQPLEGENYYRLISLAEDGTSFISNVELVWVNLRTVFSAYPNPFLDHLWIQMEQDAQSIRLLDLNGKIIRQTNEATSNNWKWDIPNSNQLSNGLYILEIRFIDGSQKSLKVLRR